MGWMLWTELEPLGLTVGGSNLNDQRTPQRRCFRRRRPGASGASQWPAWDEFSNPPPPPSVSRHERNERGQCRGLYLRHG